MDEFTYGAQQLMRAANISSLTYNQWRSRGLIRSGHAAQGTGDRQRFSFLDIFAAAILARLVSLGVSVGSASKIVYPFPEGMELGGRTLHPTGLYGFKNDRAYLIARSFPDAEHDQVADTVEHCSPFGEIVPESKLFFRIPLHEGMVIISLDKIEARVTQALTSQR